MSSQLTITKEKVLEAADKCSTAKATLEILFPDAFRNDGTVDVQNCRFEGERVMDGKYALLWKNKNSFCLEPRMYDWKLEMINGHLHLIPRRKP